MPMADAPADAKRPYSTLSAYVTHIPPSYDEKDLERTFKDYRPIHVSLHNVVAENKRYAFVDFENEKDLRDAVAALHDLPVEGHRLVVNVKRGVFKPSFSPRDRFGFGPNGPQASGRLPPDTENDPLPPASLYTDPHRIYVTGLPWAWQDRQLAAAFKDYRPTGCRVVFDVASRKPKGCGYLSFENARDMLDAIRGMNKRYFEDRYLVVKEADPSRPPAAARANGWDGSGRPKGSPPPPLSARSSGGRSPPLPSVGPDHGDSSRSRQHSLWPPERPVSGGDRAYVGCISGGPPPGFGPYSSSNRRDMTPPRRGSEGYGRHDRYRPYGSPPRNGGGRFPDSPPRRRDGSRRPDWPRRRDSSRDRRPDSPRGGGGSGRLYGDRAGYTDGQGDGYPRGGMVQDGLAAASASGSWRPPGSSPNGALPRGVWIKPEPGTAQGHVGALLPPTGRLLGAGGGHGTGAADGSDEPAASLAPQGEKGEEADPQRASMSPDICAPTPTGAAAPPPEALLPAAAAPPSAPSLPYKAWAKRLGASGGGGGGASLLDDGVGDAAAHTADALPPPATGIPGLTLDKLLFKSMLPGSFKSSDKGSRITIPTPYRKTLVAEFTALRIVPSLGVSVQVYDRPPQGRGRGKAPPTPTAMPAELHCNIDNWYLLLRGDWAAQLEPRDVVLMGKVGTTYVLLVQDEATAASAAAAAKRKDSGGGAAEAGSPGGGKGSGGKGLKGAEERAEARAAGAAAAAAPSSRDGALSDEEEEEEVSASRKLRAGSRGTSDGKGGEGGEDEAELPWVVAPGDEVIAIKDNMPVTRIQQFHVFFNATQTEKVVREFPLLKKSNRLEFPLYTTDLKEANATTADIKMDSNAYRTCIFRYGREFRDGPAVGDTIVLVKRRGKYVMLVQRAGAKPPPGGGRQRAAGGAAAAAPATSSAAKRPAEPSAAQPSPPAKAARTQGPGSGSAKQQQPQQPLPTDLDYSCELLGMIKGTLQILDALQAGPDLRQLVLARLQGMTSDERLFAWLPLVNACQRQAHEEVAALVDKLATPAGS